MNKWLWGGMGAGLLLGYRAAKRRLAPSIEGQVALVTGGSRGLGLLLSRELGRRGCQVAICARDPEELENAHRWLSAEGVEVHTVPCDVSDPDQVNALVGDIIGRFGRIDILVNAAAILKVGPLETMTREDFEDALRNTFFGTLHTSLAVLPYMRERGEGRIANVSSIGGKVAVPHLLPYDCAKFAVQGLSEGLREELLGSGISVTTVVPWLMRTGSIPNVWFKGDEREREFTAMAVLTSIPGATVNAERAAHRAVEALRWREPEVIIGWPAKLTRWAHDLAPALTLRAMGVAGRLAPSSDGGRGETMAERGMHLDTELAPSRLTELQDQAAREHNEYGTREEPTPEHAEGARLRRPQ